MTTLDELAAILTKIRDGEADYLLGITSDNQHVECGLCSNTWRALPDAGLFGRGHLALEHLAEVVEVLTRPDDDPCDSMKGGVSDATEWGDGVHTARDWVPEDGPMTPVRRERPTRIHDTNRLIELANVHRETRCASGCDFSVSGYHARRGGRVLCYVPDSR